MFHGVDFICETANIKYKAIVDVCHYEVNFKFLMHFVSDNSFGDETTSISRMNGSMVKENDGDKPKLCYFSYLVI